MGQLITKTEIVNVKKPFKIKKPKRISVTINPGQPWDVCEVEKDYNKECSDHFIMDTPKWKNLRWVIVTKKAGQYIDFFPFPIGVREWEQRMLLADWHSGTFNIIRLAKLPEEMKTDFEKSLEEGKKLKKKDHTIK